MEIHMQRTLKILALAFALLAAAGSASAQDAVAVWSPRTGDAWVDHQLDDINRYGQRYRDPFIDEMARYYSAPRALVSDLLDRHWTPGDVYYACALAQVAGQPCRSVADAWTRDHAAGWGVITQRMGIPPGSAEFHRLKRGLVTTYDRWARPIRIDESLHADFPDRSVQPAPAEPAGHDKPSQARR
jgi:hypothetical protein